MLKQLDLNKFNKQYNNIINKFLRLQFEYEIEIIIIKEHLNMYVKVLKSKKELNSWFANTIDLLNPMI
jgi:hypothetical protein